MLEIRLLGQFNIVAEGQPLELPSRPAQSLLAYLALHAGTAQRREKLAGMFSATFATRCGVSAKRSDLALRPDAIISTRMI
jgi:hypothetical protein